jgi:hypothetical protein
VDAPKVILDLTYHEDVKLLGLTIFGVVTGATAWGVIGVLLYREIAAWVALCWAWKKQGEK